jgi:hypothetical protein
MNTTLNTDQEFKELKGRLNKSERVQLDIDTRKLRFTPKLDPETVALAKKYKERLVEEAIRLHEDWTDTVICRGCLTEIADEEPCLSYQQDGDERLYPFHSEPACQFAAAAEIMKILEPGGVFWLHLHHVCGDEANGYNCEGGCFRDLPPVHDLPDSEEMLEYWQVEERLGT